MFKIHTLAVIALCAIATSPLRAQQYVPAQPIGAADSSVPASKKGAQPKRSVERTIDADAKAIYDKAIAATKAAKSLEFTADLSMISDDPDVKTMQPPGLEGKTKFTVQFIDSKPDARAPVGAMDLPLSDSIRIERLDGPNKDSIMVIHAGRVLHINNFKRTYSEGGAKYAMLVGMAMRMYPEWIHSWRDSSPNMPDGQPELISMKLTGTTLIDGLECDVIKKVVMGVNIMQDGDEDVVKNSDAKSTVMITETIAIARFDGLPRQQMYKFQMSNQPGDAADGVATGSSPPNPTITVLGLKADPKIDNAIFLPKVPEGFTKIEPEVPGLVMGGAGDAPQPKLAIKVGDPAPDFTLTSLDGKQVTLASLRGKVVLLDFWATWCGPCRAGMPTMEKLHNAYQGKKVVILGVNTFEKNADAAKSYFAKKKFTYGCLLNGDDLAKAYGVSGIPTLVIIDKEGKVAKIEMGLNDAGLRKLIDEALAQ